MIGPYQLDSIIEGDARTLADALPWQSVDMIFTDPVYQNFNDYAWLIAIAANVLKPGGFVFAFQDQRFLDRTFAATRDPLAIYSEISYQTMAIWFRSNEVKYRFSPIGKSVYTPALVYAKGEPVKHGAALDLRSFPVFAASSNFRWSKPIEWIEYYISTCTRPGAVILDPFAGGGAIPAAAKSTGRRYLGFEIDPERVVLAREKLERITPALIAPEPEQFSLDFR